MKPLSFHELYNFAKQKSPFYSQLYKGFADDINIQALPIVDSSEFWKVNGPNQNRVLTSTQLDGIVFKSGGTSGNAKFSYFSKEEWRAYTQVFGEGMSRAAITEADYVANFFYAGDLYASFMFITKSIEDSACKCIQLPLSGAADLESIVKILNEFKVNVWAGPPTTLMKIAEFAAHKNAHQPKKVLFGGESFYADQREHLTALFPQVEIRSIGYASVDGGHMGFADKTCGIGEHRVFSQHSIIEIIDADSGEVITEPQKRGKILLTNLIRTLMPIIRYPVGDFGEWVDDSSVKLERKFKILGRSEEGARIGPTTLYYDDVAAFLQKYQTQLKPTGFQLVIQHFEKLDQLVIRIAKTSTGSFPESDLLAKLELERPVLAELAQDKKIHRVSIEYISPSDLQLNRRTGKLMRIIDERF